MASSVAEPLMVRVLAEALALAFSVMGQGVGLQGQSYAIPTMQGGVETIRPYVDEFIKFAKEHGMWIPMDNVFDLGIPGPSGNENDTYVAKDTIYKVNNLLNSGGVCKLLDKILLHNLIFPNTAYRLHGFTGYDGRTIMPVLEQERICESQPATQIMIDPGTQNQEASSYCLSEVWLPDLPTISSMSSVLITKASRCWNHRISGRKYAII